MFEFNVYVPTIVQDDVANSKPIKECLRYQLTSYPILLVVCVY